MKKITILGAGSWGSTIAQHLALKKFDITLWEFDKKRAEILSRTRTLPSILPELKLPSSVKITTNITEALKAKTQTIVIAVPSFAFTNTLTELKKNVAKSGTLTFVILTKGFVGEENPVLPHLETSKIFPDSKNIAILTGPSHAEEVVRKMPTAITAASQNPACAKYVQEIFSTDYFRVYTNTDIIGAGLSGALKNIYAIAAGISDGVRLGDNTKAALVTRALAEMSRIGKLMGGKQETFLGLSGVGDLIVTCYSRHSRNRNLGEMIGKGLKLKQALRRMTMVAEGIYATKALHTIKKKTNNHNLANCPTPIADEIYTILFKNKNPLHSIQSLMTRPLKSE